MSIEQITSTQNPRIKNIVKLQKAQERREQGLFIIEGAREIGLAVQAGYSIESLFVCPELHPKPLMVESKQVYYITLPVFSKVAYREHSDGLIALAAMRAFSLLDISFKKIPLVIVLESVEKPGNLGAVLRTADAAAVDAVIICDPHTDIFNPNVIRSSIGCLFTNTVVTCSNEDALSFFTENNITVFATCFENSVNYHECDFNVPAALIFGTESAGLTPFWIKHAARRIRIPMQGKIDSLNVSNAAAITIFEVKRQRNFC